jgi:hypothetical protein
MNRRMLVVVAGMVVSFVTAVAADSGRSGSLTGVPANAKAVGFAPASRLSPELRQVALAQGSTALENPEGIIGWYGYGNDTPSPDNAAVPQAVPTFAAANPTEAQTRSPRVGERRRSRSQLALNRGR